MAIFNLLFQGLTLPLLLIFPFLMVIYALYTYFKRHSLPGPRGYPLIGSIPSFIAAEKHNEIHLMLGK